MCVIIAKKCKLKKKEKWFLYKIRDRNYNLKYELEIQNKNGKQPYYSTTIVMLTPTSTMFVVPLKDEVDNNSKSRLKDNRKVDFVMLPKTYHYLKV